MYAKQMLSILTQSSLKFRYFAHVMGKSVIYIEAEKHSNKRIQTEHMKSMSAIKLIVFFFSISLSPLSSRSAMTGV